VDRTAVSWTKVNVDGQYQILLKTIEWLHRHYGWHTFV